MLEWLLAIALLAGTSSQASHDCPSSCESPNVRTVLFRQTDLVKECWSEEELALLYTRRLLQELVPKKVPCRIPILLEYLKTILEVARDVASSVRSHRLIMLAISDAFGGYLQAYGIPITNAKYYEGTASYCSARQVNEIQMAFKKTLDTDGGGWTRPIYVRRTPNIAPYLVQPGMQASSCGNLIFNGDLGKGFKSNKDKMNIPLPFLDDLANPRAVAVPFRDRSLFSLFTRNSSDVLLRYYSVALRCFGPPPGDTTCNDAAENPLSEQFQAAFHAWLCKAVVPHLHDETWYAGFGGVYRIIEAMAQKGLLRCDSSEEAVTDDFSLRMDETCECESTSPLFYLAAVLALILLFWIIVCLLFCLIKCCSSPTESIPSCSTSTSSSGAFINALATLYCDKHGMDGKGCKSSSSTPLLIDKR